MLARFKNGIWCFIKMTKLKVCPGWGSNSRPSDYETDALPTALPRLHKFSLKKCDTHGGTRTPNLRFRRPTPYPLGHAGCDNVLNLFKFLHSNWECHPNEILHIRELQWASWFRSLESFSKGVCKSKGALLPSVVQSTAQIILFRI